MTTIVIRGPLPTQGVKPAQGQRWGYRGAANSMRKTWALLATQAMQKQPSAKRIRRCTLTYIVCPADPVHMKKVYAQHRLVHGKEIAKGKKPYSPKDRDNTRSAAKPALDGLQDAGLLVDDSHDVILSDPVEWVDKCESGYLELRITYQEDDPFYQEPEQFEMEGVAV